MSAPRLEIDIDKIRHNSRTLVNLLASRGISVTGITKAFLGSPKIARVMLEAGVSAIGDSRIENIEKMRRAGVEAPMFLIRSPMMSQVEQVVASADVSFNTELEVIKALSSAAQTADRSHGVILMVELGDLREGIMPRDLNRTIREALDLHCIDIQGIGANCACQNGVIPDANKMGELSALANAIDEKFGLRLRRISGGNSGNLPWALGGPAAGRINDLRLGESIFLGCEPLHRQPIEGLHTNAIQLIAEVIEVKQKPSLPWGAIGDTAFGEEPPLEDRGNILQAILAIGRQDIDPNGLNPPPGIKVLGASSDHLIVDSGACELAVGDEIPFTLNYSALVRAATSPFIALTVKNHFNGSPHPAGDLLP